MPEIPHGSTGMSSESLPRRTVLQWFVGVKQDGESLDNEKSDKWMILNPIRGHGFFSLLWHKKAARRQNNPGCG